MEELYQLIEEQIRLAGYEGPIDAEGIYHEICDRIEDRELGSYLLLSKQEDSVVFEYKIEVLEDQFNLSYLDIHDGEQFYHVDFDNLA
ncbi:MAG: hypothetical protein RR593_04290 [Hungatella sp.]